MATATLAKPYLLFGLVYGILGMALGIHMAASQDHGQLVTHAHLMLVGFLLSVVYAVIHRLWLEGPNRIVALVQFAVHHLGTFMMVIGLFLLYGRIQSHDTLEPLLASASIIVLIGLVLMSVMVLMSKTRG